jgi:hypothetical protein
MFFALDICLADKRLDCERNGMKMRLALILTLAGSVLGGMSACSDHDPTVVFKMDAAGDVKVEAGAPQDSGASFDAGSVADSAIVTDGAGPVVDAPSAVDLAQEANQGVDASHPVDVSADLPVTVVVDSNQVVDGPAAVDSAGSALDGSGRATLDADVDSSALHDAEGVEG